MTDTSFVVSAQYLNEHLDDPNVVIVDCRFALMEPQLGHQQYQVSHIPNASYLDLNQDLSAPVERHGGRHPLPDISQLAEKLAAIGINWGQTQVVAYDASRCAFAARLWWLLRYLGHEQVALLDGGWQAWQAAGYRVTDAIPTPQIGTFVPQLRADWVINIEQLKTCKDLPEVIVIDSRESDRYLGKQEPIDPIAGHIPGAINYPWQEVTDHQGYLHLKAQQQRWSNIVIEPKTEIIVYCGSGVTACVNLLSLELAGISTGKLYAGGWSDWCSYLS